MLLLYYIVLSETGSFAKRPLNRSASIFESKKLNVYIEGNPDALLKDVAKHFSGSIIGAFYAVEREKITLKKRTFLQGTRREGT